MWRLSFLHTFICSLWCWRLTQSAKYLIGQESNSGAFEVHFDDDKKTLDLDADCFPGKACPPVLVMTGRHVGTIDVINCHEGIMYTFVNKGDLDAGVLLMLE